MSNLLSHTIGTDSVFVFPLITTNHENEVVAPTNLAGIYVYFQVFDDAGVMILDKSNDPGGANVGITLRPPDSAGIIEAKIEHTDLFAGNTGGRLNYIVQVREDPTGLDDRYPAADGAIDIKAATAG